MRMHSSTVRRASDLLMKGVGMKVVTEVVNRTPVDTGKARSNWQVTIGQPATGELPPYAPGSHLGRNETANAAAAVASARSALATHGQGRTIYITNNVNYIEKLNHGWSQQAPANFVVHGIMTVKPFIRGQKILSRRTMGLRL